MPHSQSLASKERDLPFLAQLEEAFSQQRLDVLYLIGTILEYVLLNVIPSAKLRAHVLHSFCLCTYLPAWSVVD